MSALEEISIFGNSCIFNCLQFPVQHFIDGGECHKTAFCVLYLCFIIVIFSIVF